MHYRWKTGMLAWVLFRVTGLALVGYLAMHIMVISNLHDPNKFDATMKFLGSWQFRILELGLFFVVLYHALNGIRVIIVDFFNGSAHQARLFWGLAVLGFILFIAGAYPMVSHALYWKDVQAGKIQRREASYKTSSSGEVNRPSSDEGALKGRRRVKKTRKVRSEEKRLMVGDQPGSEPVTSHGVVGSKPTIEMPPDPANALKNKPIEPITIPQSGGGK